MVELTPGALLTMYSDGVTDTMNEAQELFGIQRLIDTLITSARNRPRGSAAGWTRWRRLPQKRRAFRRLHPVGAQGPDAGVSG